MRIDKFLKNSRLIKRRTVAKDACDQERVSVNGKVVKAGAEVKEGDSHFFRQQLSYSKSAEADRILPQRGCCGYV